jgi:hypothetical protein
LDLLVAIIPDESRPYVLEKIHVIWIAVGALRVLRLTVLYGYNIV